MFSYSLSLSLFYLYWSVSLSVSLSLCVCNFFSYTLPTYIFISLCGPLFLSLYPVLSFFLTNICVTSLIWLLIFLCLCIQILLFSVSYCIWLTIFSCLFFTLPLLPFVSFSLLYCLLVASVCKSANNEMAV